MTGKKIIIFLLLLIVMGVAIYFIISNVSITKSSEDNYSNYTPQEEISDEQLRQTSIALYFLDNATGILKSEAKLIDSSKLLENPYKFIVEKLLEGPSNEQLSSVFPENTKLIDASLSENCVILNFSEELLNYKDDTQKYNIINSILGSLTQLTEVNSIKFLINSKEHDEINEEYTPI